MSANPDNQDNPAATNTAPPTPPPPPPEEKPDPNVRAPDYRRLTEGYDPDQVGATRERSQ
jgi:hypothetical protein